LIRVALRVSRLEVSCGNFEVHIRVDGAMDPTALLRSTIRASNIRVFILEESSLATSTVLLFFIGLINEDYPFVGVSLREGLGLIFILPLRRSVTHQAFHHIHNVALL